MQFPGKLFVVSVAVVLASFSSATEKTEPDSLTIRKTIDFEISGTGKDDHWNKTAWLTLPLLKSSGADYTTRVKFLYSETGLYFLFFCEDKKLTATMEADFLDLWNEDVIEIFLQPDASVPAYFEYELSPLNHELPITIYNEKGKLNSWIPFHYEGDRKTKHFTTVHGGPQKSNAKVTGWTSEIFVPYPLLKPLLTKPPVSGSRWKGNLNRIDYDQGEALWAWQRNSGDFHAYDKFGIFEFE